jgi:hypothetical protein
MKVRQIDLAQRVIRLEPGTTKNREGREVVMTREVYTLFSGCISGKAAGDYVFTRRSQKRVRDFRGTWETACTAAGVPGLVYQDCCFMISAELRLATCVEQVSPRL